MLTQLTPKYSTETIIHKVQSSQKSLWVFFLCAAARKRYFPRDRPLLYNGALLYVKQHRPEVFDQLTTHPFIEQKGSQST
jgi:hypothetical protein